VYLVSSTLTIFSWGQLVEARSARFSIMLSWLICLWSTVPYFSMRFFSCWVWNSSTSRRRLLAAVPLSPASRFSSLEIWSSTNATRSDTFREGFIACIHVSCLTSRIWGGLKMVGGGGCYEFFAHRRLSIECFSSLQDWRSTTSIVSETIGEGSGALNEVGRVGVYNLRILGGLGGEVLWKHSFTR